jgi:hypothetical protein
MNHTPATPLPWKVVDASVFSGKAKVCIAVEYPNGDSAAYIAHAANAYPKLVEALREELFNFGDRVKAHERHRALLRSLGEE